MTTTAPIDVTVAIDSEGWDLHVEQVRAARFARAVAGEGSPRSWVATVSRDDLVLEAEGDTAGDAVARLWDEIRAHRRRTGREG